jgi:hypothetical protein
MARPTALMNAMEVMHCLGACCMANVHPAIPNLQNVLRLIQASVNLYMIDVVKAWYMGFLPSTAHQPHIEGLSVPMHTVFHSDLLLFKSGTSIVEPCQIVLTFAGPA